MFGYCFCFFFSAVVSLRFYPNAIHDTDYLWVGFNLHMLHAQTVVHKRTHTHTPNRAKTKPNTQILIINRYYNLIGFSSTLMCASFRFIEIGWLAGWPNDWVRAGMQVCVCECVWWSRPKPAEYNSVLIMLEFICWSVCFFGEKEEGTDQVRQSKSEHKVSGGLCVMYNNEMHVCVCVPMRQVRTINSWDGGKFINLR